MPDKEAMLVDSSFQPGFPVNNAHLETVVPYFLRPMEDLPYERERIETKDHDFLDLDWVKKGSKKLGVLSQDTRENGFSKIYLPEKLETKLFLQFLFSMFWQRRDTIHC